MAGVRYSVDIDLQVNGNPGAKLGNLQSQAKSIGADFAKAGQKLADGFTGAVEAIGAKAISLGKIGIGAGIAAATYGVLGLNNELESTKVSLAAVLNANGIGGGMAGAMEKAAGWVQQMKKDAKDLPGEFSDLLGIVQSGASAAFNAGLNVQSFEKLSAQAMAAGKAMAVPMDQAGRELAQLLEGRAGAHNVFGTRLGIHASEFNTKSNDQRIKMLTDALGKFEPAIKVFGNTFDAQSSTLIDNVKSFVGAATGPLFDKVKGTLGDANAWFDNNQMTVKKYADNIGYHLANAFDYGKGVVLEYGPLLIDFVERAYDKIVRLWQDAEPYVKSIGKEIKGFLTDDGAFDKIGTILKLYIAAKGGGAALSIGKDAIGAFSSLKGLGLFGGSGSAAAGTAGAAAAGGGSFAAQAAAYLGEGAVTVGAGSAAAIGSIVAAVAAVLGFSAYEIGSAWSKKETTDAVGGGAYGYSEGQRKFVDTMIDKGIKAGDAMGQATDAALEVPAGFSAATDAAQEFASIIRSLAKSGDFNAISKINQGIDDAEARARRADETNEMISSGMNVLSQRFQADEAGRGGHTGPSAIEILATQAIDAAKDAKKAEAENKRNKGVGGKGGTTIHKVEITVSNNNNPNQVARDVAAELQNMRRYRKSSPRVQNWSAG